MRLNERGFTLVELMVVMVIMVILLGLGVAAMGNIQAQARDKERDADVATLARGLEQRYKQGIDSYMSGWTYSTVGSYPDNSEVFWAVDGGNHALNGSDNTAIYSGCGSRYTPCPQDDSNFKTTWLPGTSLSNFYSPSNSDQTPDGPRLVSPASSGSITKATFVSQGYYYYESFDATGAPCYLMNAATGPPCVRFTITYQHEADGQTIVVKSKHQ